MYIEEIKSQGKYTAYLLRESYREGGQVKHRTIANLSHCPPEVISAMKLAIKHKNDLAQLISIPDVISLRQGLSVGTVFALSKIAEKIGITQALGNSVNGKRALWQIIARVIDQGSRLSAVRLAESHAACDVLGLDKFNEDHLYENLEWVYENQTNIEDALFQKEYCGKKPELFLYDVTSTYMEGMCNELAAFGYNRDGKKGKMQLVVGLLCDGGGIPLSVEVFEGNTQDPKTFAVQIKKVVERFGGETVTFVGDRGMIKAKQIEELTGEEFHYITAITKPQIEAMLVRDVFQMSLFESDLGEVFEDGVRYVLRRNPKRAEEMQANREGKLNSVNIAITKENERLTEHPCAKVETGLKKIQAKVKKYKMSKWLSVEIAEGRSYSLSIIEDELEKASKLDGCYVIKSDLSAAIATKELIHERYKDLARVEIAFRSMKIDFLELRPVHVRLEIRTRGHVFVVMMAYRIILELKKCWAKIDMTAKEGIIELGNICTTEVWIKDQPCCSRIPMPRERAKKLLDCLELELPEAIPCKGIRVSSRKKLVRGIKTH